MAELVVKQPALLTEMNKTPGKPTHRHETTQRGHEFVLFLVVAAIVLLTWEISRAGYFTSGSIQSGFSHKN